MTKIFTGPSFRARAAIGALIVAAAIVAAGPASAGENCYTKNAPLYDLTHTSSAYDRSVLHDKVVACQQAHGQSMMQSSHLQNADAELPMEDELNRKMR
jgi:hypothetical protein